MRKVSGASPIRLDWDCTSGIPWPSVHQQIPSRDMLENTRIRVKCTCYKTDVDSMEIPSRSPLTSWLNTLRPAIIVLISTSPCVSQTTFITLVFLLQLTTKTSPSHGCVVYECASGLKGKASRTEETWVIVLTVSVIPCELGSLLKEKGIIYNATCAGPGDWTGNMAGYRAGNKGR